MNDMKLGSLFAGIGGIDLGFDQAGVKGVWANEINVFCAETYKLNFPATKLIVDDIRNLNADDIVDINILSGGFPCQPFSVAGYRKGFDDDRGTLFNEITRILYELKVANRLPDVVFLENVKNLFTHNKGKTYNFMKDELHKVGYHVTENILNTYRYGNIPQNRERLYIIGFKEEEKKNRFLWPDPIELTNKIDKFILWNARVHNKYYYTKESKCYEILNDNVLNTNTIYQYRRIYVRENKSKVSPTLTANMGMGGHNVPIIKDALGHIRKLTPPECLALQGFPENFNIPINLPDTKIYQQAGNSVSVPVIKRLADAILKALN
jgi:DNA (cytosine-5)-methyltransferase 1